jgi:hypothetical protein
VNDAISNSGKSACDLSASLNKDSSAVAIKITIPKVLNATRVLDANHIVLNFPAIERAPVLKFNQASYNAAFGGAVTRVAASQDNAVISTANVCVGVGIRTLPKK